jgi:putative nicotinate phosphoribosyltransferase
METTAFLTDKYEVTMLQAMLRAGRADHRAVFDLFARRLPKGRRYGVVGGVGRVVEAVKNFRFTDEQIAYLEADPIIDEATVRYLRDYKFRGIIVGQPEGSLYFPNTPILTVIGTFADCVLLETLLLSIMNHDSAVMSAASRMVTAAEGMPMIEMGSRRTSETSAIAAARAAYIAGFNATSNLQAGHLYQIPTTGTSAHAYTLAYGPDGEEQSFYDQMVALGTDTTILVDTYNIPEGIRRAVHAANTLGVSGPGGIRIDSGDLHEETVNARELLDSLGAIDTKIVLSSDIDEYTISEMKERGTPVDAVGAGTRVVTGSGAPTAEMVYKLVQINDMPVSKRAEGKISTGGIKVTYREFHEDGTMAGEFFKVGTTSAPFTSSQHPTQILLVDGQGDYFHQEDIEVSRARHREQVAYLPESARLILAGDAAFTAQQAD